MALSDTDLHWIPMNRDKFNQLRKMFDSNGTKPAARPCDKCTSPRIRYSSAENVTALSQIRALLRPVEPDDSSTSSRSRNTSEDSVDGCTNNFNSILRDNKPSPRLPNGFVVIDPVACQKANGFLKLNGSAEVLASNNINNQFNCLRESEVDPLLYNDNVNEDIIYKNNKISDTAINQSEEKLVDIIENNNIDHTADHTGDTKKENISERLTADDDSDNSVDEVRANSPFLKYVNDEADKLSKKRQYFVNILESGEHQITDEVTGRIMATCGKANLLLTSKFKQYRTLCTEYDSKNRKMTSDDMHGFWDLIMLQVNDVNKMFDECKVMEKNNWQPPKSPMPPKKKPMPKSETPIKNRTPAKPKAKSAAQIARDEARRKMMTERKEQLKLAKLNAANNQATIEIYT